MDCNKMSACWAKDFITGGCEWNFEGWEELRSRFKKYES